MSRPLLLVLSLLLAAGCSSAPGDTGGEETDGRVTAVATVFPLAWLATEVAPDADVTFLGSRGQDPHDLELSPNDRAQLETADVLLYMGELDFQPQVESAVASARGEVVDAAAVAGPDRLRGFEHGHEGDVDGGHEEGEAVDPHLWFDPLVMADVALEVGAAFATADPKEAATYEENAAALAARFRDLDAELDDVFSDCRHDTAITSHEAYAYLLEPRGLHQEGISGAGGHGDASPQRLAELTERIREEQVAAIAAEPVEGRADAEALAGEAGVEIVEVDPLEVAPAQERGLIELLRDQAAAFATVLGCG